MFRRNNRLFFWYNLKTILGLCFLDSFLCNSSLNFIIPSKFAKISYKQFTPLLFKAIYFNNWHQELGSWKIFKFDPKNLFLMAEKLPFGEGASINRPPLFCGLNYQFWKVRMKIFVESLDRGIWDAIDCSFMFIYVQYFINFFIVFN